jgi:FtsP/CotA-like multicopper oxidase with cupredoxin domain
MKFWKFFKYFSYIFIGIVLLIIVIFTLTAFFLPSPNTKFINESQVLENRLNIPSQLMPREENGEKVFDLKMQEGETEFFSGKKTNTFGFNGTYLGPVIRVHKDDKVRINVTNNLKETTSAHWHGMHLPASMDGGPHQFIKAGESWQPYWTVTNEAATLWYHPHLMGKTGEHVYKGLAGLFIIDDENSDSLNLPKEYGIDDIPLIIQDRKFDSNGQFVYDHDPNSSRIIDPGVLGDIIIVNGTRAPYVDVPAKLVRLRILNGSNARRYNFGFSDNRKFYQIASDGGFLPAPVERTRMMLAPAERAEIVVDLANTTNPLTFMSYEVVDDVNPIINLFQRIFLPDNDEYQQFKILELRPQAGNFARQEIPHKLNTIKRFDKDSAIKTRQFSLDFNAREINSKKMDHSRVDQIVRKEDLEIWEVRNESISYHPFHIHGVQFQVLDRDRKEPHAYEKGWKDTVIIEPAERVRLIMRFTQFTDPNMPYMFHCHILEHEDMGMMGQFVVVDDLSDEVKINSPLLNTPLEKHMQH